MSAGGRLTAEMGARLEQWLTPIGYQVLYDHGTEKGNVGNIVSWYGTGKEPTFETEFSQIDIAVVKPSSDDRKVCALIEIEEGNDRPKNILGDLFGTLLADHIGFGREELSLDSRTALLIMAHGPAAHRERMQRLVEAVRACRGLMLGRNSIVGHIAGDLFSDEKDLEAKVRSLVEEAVGRFEGDS